MEEFWWMSRIAGALVWAGLCAAFAGEVEVTRDARLRETQLTLTEGDCRITWTIYESELNAGGIRHRSNCARDLAGQAPMLRALLRRAMQEQVVQEKFRTLSWGRLVPDGARDYTLGIRVALAAKRAEDWNLRTGRPLIGVREVWVARALEQGDLHAEVRTAFAEEGWHLRVTSVEKALVAPAGKLPFFARLRAAGVKETDRVPFDVQLWFHAQRADQ